MSDSRPRWTHQTLAVNGARDAISRGVKRIVVTAPTGSGKSLCQSDLLEGAVADGKLACLFTQRRLLYDQIANNLTRDGIPFGRIAAGHDKDLAKPVQLVMMQTELARSKKGFQLPRHDLVIVDEYHQFGGVKFQEILARQVELGAHVVGFTATPLDLVGVDELIIAATVPDLIRKHILVPAETFAPDEPDLHHIRNYQVGEDLSEKDNAKAILRPGVFGRVVKAWRQYNPSQKPTLLFGPDVDGAKFFYEQFCKSGIRAAHIDGEDVILDGVAQPSTTEARANVLDLYRAGEVKIITNRFVMREGIDLPETECMILASAFGSLSSYLQAGGRGLRACPERAKTKCTVIDHGGNWHRLGSLNAERLWRIDSTNKQMVSDRQANIRSKKEIEPICCPKCGKVRLHGRACESCGFMTTSRSRIVVQIDGTLRKVGGDIYRPRVVHEISDQDKKWQNCYYRARNSKQGMTFKQAEALYFREHGVWPPRNLKLMPIDESDWNRKVASVPREMLIGTSIPIES